MATITFTLSLAQQSNEGAYSCTAESSGGIVYNEKTKKWQGTSFRPLSRFTLKLKYVRTAAIGDEYAASITPNSGNDVFPCISYQTQLALVDQMGYLSCQTAFFNYRFNLNDGRFVEAYLMGYINGRDNNDDTPVLSGGVCKKIE
jgi:hypothetical protein